MSIVLDHLDELDLLVRAARRPGIQPEKFAAGMRDAMEKISTLLAKNPPAGFLDADFALSEALEDYEKHPGVAGVGKIGNALVSYRRTATSC
jgi:predicted component of type VI protein secretion system